MKEVKVSLPEPDIQLLDQIAKENREQLDKQYFVYVYFEEAKHLVRVKPSEIEMVEIEEDNEEKGDDTAAVLTQDEKEEHFANGENSGSPRMTGRKSLNKADFNTSTSNFGARH